MELKYRIAKWIDGRTSIAQAKGVVLGFSGGIDSAVCLKLSLLGLPRNQVHALWMPRDFDQSQEYNKYVKPLMELLPLVNSHTPWLSHILETIHIEWTDSVDENYYDMDEEKHRVDYGNLASRLRMALLYLYARPRKLLVMCCSNKTEMMVGYTAKWGDSVGDLAPIGNLYKSEVNELALDLDVPEVIRNRAPTAGLWEGQTDEGEMGITYEDLDSILYKLDRRNSKAIWSGSYRKKLLDQTYMEYGHVKVDKVRDMIERSRHKRCCAIPTYKYDHLDFSEFE